MGVHNKNKQYGFASVKPRDAQVINKVDKKRLFVISSSVIAILALIWGVSVFLKSDLDTKVKDGFTKILTKEDVVVKNSEIILGDGSDKTPEYSNNVAAISYGNNFSTKQTVKLALLASPNLFDYKNYPVLGCDALVFAETKINKTPKVLNSTLALLFNDDFDYGFPPANFISSTQKNLKFDHAVIDNGVAKVFLNGKITIDDSKCDSNRVIYQINETSKQFSAVKSVQIFLNGEKIEL